MTPAPILIRDELEGDRQAIYGLTQRAFAPMVFRAGNEQDLINTLRDGAALALSLVAILGDEVVGHVAFSPATTADAAPGWFGLGPVSVEPTLQRQGIGSALIKTGLKRLVAMNAAGCILTGNPAYYTRFGFRLFPSLAPACEPAQYFMVLPFADSAPASVFAFHPLFYA
jgi:putative acetyltransferase